MSDHPTDPGRTPAPRDPLWAYELLRPGRRPVAALRVAAPPPGCGLSGETLVLSSPDAGALLAVAAATLGERAPHAAPPWRVPARRATGPADTSLLGVPGESPRLLVATRPEPGDRAGRFLLFKPGRCDACGACVPVCPTNVVALDTGEKLRVDERGCLECFACAEACPRDALLPVAHPAPEVTLPDLTRPAGRLALPAEPPKAPAPPVARKKPFYVLGLAVATMQENGAALLRDGELVGAVEEERFSRVKHQGFRLPGRPHRTLCNDLTLRYEDAIAWRSVRWLLEAEGISLEDVDVIAVNGIAGRFRRSYSLDDASRPPRILKSGRWVFVPHHLAHAASTYFLGGRRDAFVLTVDGRGDRETAAFFRGTDGRLERVFDVLSLEDSSIGGVYETVTRILGLGSHGQGSTMALAVMGEPTYDFSDALFVERHDRTRIHEQVALQRFSHLRRTRFDPMRDEHRNLAASLQQALEDAIVALVEEGRAGERVRHLCLAGGVALNCQMNSRLRRHFAPESMFVQPAANDAGTAIGAAFVAHQQATGDAPFQAMPHAYLGPAYSDAQIDEAIQAFGLEARRMDDVPARVAELVAGREVVAWYQGRLEIGPRALGGRTLLAHPGDAAVHPRLNTAKGREPWRPFAPSVLAGREAEWFDNDAGNPFMLFVSDVKPEKREAVAAIVHKDGTTRPQSVSAEAAPLYHRMIQEFDRRTGIPMVLNTSFNTADEPIVCTPRDAVSSFLQLDADWLAIGDRLVRHPNRPDAPARARPAARPPEPPPAPAPAAASYRRLLLRLGTRCNNSCVHCPVRDLAGRPERDTAQALRELAEGRRRGCTEVVLLRGEPLVRKDILHLVQQARGMGYGHVQLQTNGRVLALPNAVQALLRAGVTFFEVSLYGDDAPLHDAISRAPGSFEQTVAGLRALVQADAPFLVNVPVLTANCQRLDRVVARLQEVGVGRVGFSLVRPVWLPDKERFDAVPTARPSRAGGHVRAALRAAVAAGMSATTEGVPLCQLDPDQWDAAELPGEIDAQLVSELGRTVAATGIRDESRRPGGPCSRCRVEARCAKPWSALVHLYGDGELTPIE